MIIANTLGLSLIFGMLFNILGIELQRKFDEVDYPYTHQIGLILENIGIVVELPWDTFITFIAIIYRFAGIAISDNDIYVGRKKRRK